MPRAFILAGAVVVPMVVGMLTTMPVAGQAPTAATRKRSAEAYTPPRTPDGQPDLQGFWTNATYTPLERPDNVTKAFYTPEEAAEVEKRAGRANANRRRLGRWPTSTTTLRSSRSIEASPHSPTTCEHR
jgi:hypothetical protein